MVCCKKVRTCIKMATDFKMENFAYNIFKTVFLSHRLIQNRRSSFDIYEDEGFNNPDGYEEICDDLFHKAIFCRRELFQIVYKGELMCEKIESFKSPSDLLNYLINRCNQDYLFHNLNVFERMFATCGFVVSMCVHIYWYNVIDVISYGHMFWTIFFNQYTEEFYKEGGWNELKRVAKTYDSLYEFLALFPENFDNYFGAIKEATVNYRHFKEVAFSKECKHVSTMWIRYRIENLKTYVKIPVSYEISLNPVKIEFLLGELRQLCDHLSNDLKYSNIFQNGGSKVNAFNEFTSTDDFDCDDTSLDRNQIKRDDEFLSADNSCSSVYSFDGRDISLGISEIHCVNKFAIDFCDSSSSVEDSDSDMPQERYRGRELSAGMTSRTFETCPEIKTEDVTV